MSFDFTDKAKVRLEIITVSREMFLEEGIQATSIRKIAKRLGIAASTIYKYFHSKDYLLLDSIFHKQISNLADIKIDCDTITDIHSMIQSIVDTFFHLNSYMLPLNKSILKELFQIRFKTEMAAKLATDPEFKFLNKKPSIDLILRHSKEKGLITSNLPIDQLVDELRNIELLHIMSYIWNEPITWDDYRETLEKSIYVFLDGKY